MTVAASVVLAGCATSTASHTGGTHVAHDPHRRPAIVLVHLGLFGGPARADGTMALNNAPYRHQVIRLVDAAGRSHTARTGRYGVATFVVPPGRYHVGTVCGRGPRHVTARPGQRARISLQCDVP